MNFFLCAALDCFLVPAGAVAATTVSTIRTGISILAVMAVWSMVAPHTVAMPITSTVSLAVSSTRTRIRRNLACLELEINPLVAHLGFEGADFSLQSPNLLGIRIGCIQRGVKFCRLVPNLFSHLGRVIDELLMQFV